jgi:hypothetical protein
MTAKTCAIPGGPPGLFPTQQTGQLAGGMRQVMLTYFIAVPLWASHDKPHQPSCIHKRTINNYLAGPTALLVKE